MICYHIVLTHAYLERRYDPVALLCALPSKRYLFNPTVKRVLEVDHWVIGTSAKNHGIRTEAIEELTSFMYTNFFRGVTLDYSEFKNTLAVVNDSDELARRRQAEEARNISRNIAEDEKSLHRSSKERQGKSPWSSNRDLPPSNFESTQA